MHSEHRSWRGAFAEPLPLTSPSPECQVSRRGSRKLARATDWQNHLWSARSGRISLQVLQEFYVTVTRELKPGLDLETARTAVRSLLAWQPVATDEQSFEVAWGLQETVINFPGWTR